MEFPVLIQSFLELGFPVVVTAYLLWFQSQKLDAFAKKINEIKIGQAVILSKLDAYDEYLEAVRAAKLESKE